MKMYEFGDCDKPVILLLPGTCCYWRGMFPESLVNRLVEKFHVIIASYDGFDDTENVIFPSMLEETAKIEEWIMEHCGGTIHAAYGSSLGGSFVGLLVERQKIHINHGILGSSDLDEGSLFYAKVQSALMLPVISKMVRTGEIPWIVRGILKDFGDLAGCMGIGTGGLPFVKKESIENQYITDLTTKLGMDIEVPGTTVHCFYARKMGKRYLKRYRMHFHNPVIVDKDYQHEEMLATHPEEWVAEVYKACEV